MGIDFMDLVLCDANVICEYLKGPIKIINQSIKKLHRNNERLVA
jgi:hypothetical protein